MQFKRNPWVLGDILIELGYVDSQDLKRFDKASTPIGQTLVNAGLLSVEQLEEALLYQKVYRGELSASDASQIHKTKRRRLMAEVLDGLRNMSDLSTLLVNQNK